MHVCGVHVHVCMHMCVRKEESLAIVPTHSVLIVELVMQLGCGVLPGDGRCLTNTDEEGMGKIDFCLGIEPRTSDW